MVEVPLRGAGRPAFVANGGGGGERGIGGFERNRDKKKSGIGGMSAAMPLR
jgi:hypothetical protein